MQLIKEWFQNSLNLSSALQTRLLSSLVIILAIWLLRILAMQFVGHRTEDVGVRYRWRKTTAYLATFLSVLFVGLMWVRGVQSMATFLGLLSAGLAIALRDPVTNLVGWAFILWRRPFTVGDRIQIGDYAGDVIDLRIFQFTLLEIGNWVTADQSTGRMLHIPNAKIFQEVLANYTTGFEYIWNEVAVCVTFESDWEKAKTILQEIADQHAAQLSEAAAERIRQAAQRFMITYSKLTPIVYTRVEESGVLLTIRYMCQPRRRRSSEHAIWEDVLRAFDRHSDIEFAYPTQRFYHRWVEGSRRPDNPGQESAMAAAKADGDSEQTRI